MHLFFVLFTIAFVTVAVGMLIYLVADMIPKQRRAGVWRYRISGLWRERLLEVGASVGAGLFLLTSLAINMAAIAVVAWAAYDPIRSTTGQGQALVLAIAAGLVANAIVFHPSSPAQIQHRLRSARNHGGQGYATKVARPDFLYARSPGSRWARRSLSPEEAERFATANRQRQWPEGADNQSSSNDMRDAG